MLSCVMKSHTVPSHPVQNVNHLFVQCILTVYPPWLLDCHGIRVMFSSAVVWILSVSQRTMDYRVGLQLGAFGRWWKLKKVRSSGRNSSH